jgi:hypothetical protein
MPELDDILAAEQARLEADPLLYPRVFGRPPADPPSSRTAGKAYDTAVTVAVGLEQDGAELRRLLRFLHREDHAALAVEHTEDGPVRRQVCWSGCGSWPCLTRLLLDDDELAAGMVREDIAGMSDASG